MSSVERPISGKYGALISWIRSGKSARAGVSGRARSPSGATQSPAANGDPDADSLLDGLSDLEVMVQIEEEVRRLRLANRELETRLEERILAIEALRETEQRYRTLVTNAPTALIETDTVGTIVYANPTAGEAFGCDSAELVGKPVWQLAATDSDRETMRSVFIPHGRKAKTTIANTVAVSMRHGDGEARDVEIALAWKTEARGRLVGAIASMVDVTERTRGHAELEASAHVYRDMFDRAPAMLLTVDARTTSILECNTAVLEATGYSRAEILDRSVFDLYDPEYVEAAAESFRKFLHTGEVRDVRLRLRRKNGSPLYVIETSVAVEDENGAILACRTVWQPSDAGNRAALPHAARNGSNDS